MSSGGKTINSVELSLEIIEELKKQDGARVTDLAANLDRSEPTIYYHLNTMVKKHFVRRDDSGRYHLALRFLELAHFARERLEFLDPIREQVNTLASDTGEISLFSVPEYWYTVCLHVARGEDAVKIPLFVGRRHPLHSTAVGKALLAHLPEEQTIELLENHGLEKLTDRTTTEPDVLLEELATIRDRGVAYNRGETLAGLVGVGAPVMDHEDNLVGAISIIGPEERLDDQKLNEEFPKLLRQHANIMNLDFTSFPRYSWEKESEREVPE